MSSTPSPVSVLASSSRCGWWDTGVRVPAAKRCVAGPDRQGALSTLYSRISAPPSSSIHVCPSEPASSHHARLPHSGASEPPDRSMPIALGTLCRRSEHAQEREGEQELVHDSTHSLDWRRCTPVESTSLCPRQQHLALILLKHLNGPNRPVSLHEPLRMRPELPARPHRLFLPTYPYDPVT
mmetsp:Transcript_3156/g.9613  ORF Transcript_3156/g.9613 Transcript_3156/m.9613 type:complete len:182 (-) Transcript_3156:16-561(-)